MFQPNARGEARREQGGEHGAGIAGAGDAQRRALVLGRIPARGQRQRHREGGAGDAEHEAEQQHLARSCSTPNDQAASKAGDHDDLA